MDKPMTRKVYGNDFLVLPCSCDSYLGSVPATAALMLQKENHTHLTDFLHTEMLLSGNRQSLPLKTVVVVDGCSRSCLKKQFTELHIKLEKYLNLEEDLALEERADTTIAEDDLVLAQDAIVAAAATVEHLFPKISGGCCC
jgi:uncharacterized metal-binding protein